MVAGDGFEPSKSVGTAALQAAAFDRFAISGNEREPVRIAETELARLNLPGISPRRTFPDALSGAAPSGAFWLNYGLKILLIKDVWLN